MKTITATRGEKIFVDDDDFEKFGDKKWRIHYRKGRIENSVIGYDRQTRKIVNLARLIMNPQKGKQVDHINGNIFDNRKSNLRTCSQQDNLKNKKIYSNNKLGVKGVYYDKSQNLYVAQIIVNKKKIHRRHKDINVCIEYRKTWEKKYFREFAR